MDIIEDEILIKPYVWLENPHKIQIIISVQKENQMEISVELILKKSTNIVKSCSKIKGFRVIHQYRWQLKREN